jgi:hypothetical protein
MAYRDARGQAMMDADWTAIEDQLLRAYQLLKTAVVAHRYPLENAIARAFTKAQKSPGRCRGF